MKMRFHLFTTFLIYLLGTVPGVSQSIHETLQGDVFVEKIVGNLNQPWAIAFLEHDGLLFSERSGKLTVYRDGATLDIQGVPAVRSDDTAGLLDVVLDPDFGANRLMAFAYNKPMLGGGDRLAVATAQLSPDETKLENIKDIFISNDFSLGVNEVGARIVFAADGTLFITLGDRHDLMSAQDTNRHSGKVIRINKDGSVPSDNPGFSSDEIFSLGHRNAQGAAIDAKGRLWISEHGPQGGDEVNLIVAGQNYGWPLVTHGKNYDDTVISQFNTMSGMTSPKYQWTPSMAPSGLMVYSGKMWPAWAGDIFVGSLKFNYISRLITSDDQIHGEEKLFADQFYRIRDIQEAPDGSIYFIAIGQGAIFRLSKPD